MLNSISQRAGRFVQNGRLIGRHVRKTSQFIASVPPMRAVATLSAGQTTGAAGAARGSYASWLAIGAGAAAVAWTASSIAESRASPWELSIVDEMHEHPERYARERVHEAVVKLLEDDFEGDDTAAQWRLARAAYCLAMAPHTPADRKKALLEEATDVMQRAVRLDGNNSDMRRWYGRIVDAYGEFQGMRDYIESRFEVKNELEQAIEINPNDIDARYLLGMWAYRVAKDNSWYTWLASWIAATPPTASIDEAYTMFLRAEQIQPDTYKNVQLMIARCCHELGKDREAVEWLRRLLDIPLITLEDRASHREALNLLKHLDPKAYETAEMDGKLVDLETGQVKPPIETISPDEREAIENMGGGVDRYILDPELSNERRQRKARDEMKQGSPIGGLLGRANPNR